MHQFMSNDYRILISPKRLAADANILTGHPAEAIKEFRIALQLKPDYVDAERNLQTLLQSVKE